MTSDILYYDLMKEKDFKIGIYEIIKLMTCEYTQCNFACQTPIHFYDKIINNNYESNKWNLRRKNLAMANLKKKKTNGIQTIDSHFRRESCTQHWEPKVNDSQTKYNKGQSMPQCIMHLAGLKGNHETKMKVVKVNLDIGQSYEH